MKTRILTLIIAAASIIAFAPNTSRAQAPMGAQAAQNTTPQILATTPEQRAAAQTLQWNSQMNYLFTSIVKARANGLPASGNLPAVTAQQIDDAYGPASVAKLQAAAAALSPAPAASSPSPAP